MSRRFFSESLEGESLELSAEESRHALDVLRLPEGSEVEVFDGAGHVAAGLLQSTGKAKAVVRVTGRQPPRPRPEPAIELAFAVPKGKRLGWLLEKATEIGVSRLAPVVFQRSVAEPELSDALRRRWRVICIAAAKQSGGEFLPEIAPPAPLAEFLAAQKADIRMVGAPAAERNIPSLLQQWTPGKSIAILIGPEGGLAESEAAQVQQGGFVPVRLGEFVLRVETAAVAILAATRMYCQLFQPAR